MKIDLTADEEVLLSEIEFDALRLREHAEYLRNADKVESLLKSLLERKGVPEHRLRYFTDPECNVGGRGKSREQRWRENGNSTEEILRHPNFLRIARYFIYGPQLPNGVIAAFSRAVADCGQITSGDVEPLRKTARTLARQYGLTSAHEDQFYQLALETMGSYYASSIRDAIMHVR